MPTAPAGVFPTPVRLAWHSLRHYRRAALALAAGVAVGVAVIVGALAVGDSVRQTLRQWVGQRLGATVLALDGGDRFITRALTERVAGTLGRPVAGVIQTVAVALGDDPAANVNGVQVLGVGGDWAGIYPGAAEWIPGEDEIVLSAALARRIGHKVGETVVLRVRKPSALPAEAPLGHDKDGAQSLRLTIRAILPGDGAGRFSLRAGHVPPLNAFVARDRLARLLDLGERVNLALVADSPRGPSGEALAKQAQAALRAHGSLADLMLELIARPATAEIELRSERVFLDAALLDVARASGVGGTPRFTYLLTGVRVGERETPYVFAAAGPYSASTNLARAGLAPVVFSRDLAGDLLVTPGAEARLDFVMPGETPGAYVTTRVAVAVTDVVAPVGRWADRSLAPDFPGLTDVADCRRWEPGVSVDIKRIRPADEAYWKTNGPTPRVFLPYDVGLAWWSNRYGLATSFRYPADSNALERIAESLRAQLDPAALGLSWRAVREEGLRAAAQGTDFGELFLGLSGFLVIAALVLVGLLLRFALQARVTELGTLLALGFGRARIWRQLALENLLVVVTGTLGGIAAGAAYGRAVLYGLRTVWRGAVNAAQFEPAFGPAAWGAGALAGAGLSALVLAMTLRSQLRRTLHDLQTGGQPASVRSLRRWRWQAIASCVAVGGALMLLLSSDPGRGRDAAGVFFGAGTLLLLGLIGLTSVALAAGARRFAGPEMHRRAFIAQGLHARHGRSLAVVASLACGVFMVTAVAANRQTPNRAAGGRRDTGTGGFAYVGALTLPLHQDLNGAEGRRALRLPPELPGSPAFVPLRRRDGDDASCENLNRVTHPPLLGVAPAALAERGAFRFVEFAPGANRAAPWLNLDQSRSDGTIPAIVDQGVMVWGLGKRIGDIIEYRDDAGKSCRIRLVAALASSVFQGHLLIGERDFMRHFGQAGGHRWLLIETTTDAAGLAGVLNARLAGYGLELEDAADRLARFSVVENTYLGVFLALGGLGLILGGLGLGVVVARNLNERRVELGLLRALGCPPSLVRRLVLREHAGLLGWGLLCGIVAALLAALPALTAPGLSFPWRSAGITLGLVALNGWIWTAVSTRLAMRGDPAAALRDE